MSNSTRREAERIAPWELFRREPSAIPQARAELIAAIDAALQARDERAAKKAKGARLPRGYQWGHDAMEQFNFGKERAARAIMEDD